MSTPTQETSAPAARGNRSALRILLVVVAAFAVYQGAMHLVRRHVDGLVEEQQGQTLFDFSLEDLDGRTWTAASLRGRKVVLNFFRSQCQMCGIEAPTMREFARVVDPERVVVLGIMMDRVQGFAPQTTQQTLMDFGYRHPVLMADEAFLDAFHGAGWSHVTPITYVADESGKITATFRGHQPLQTLLDAVR